MHGFPGDTMSEGHHAPAVLVPADLAVAVAAHAVEGDDAPARLLDVREQAGDDAGGGQSHGSETAMLRKDR